MAAGGGAVAVKRRFAPRRAVEDERECTRSWPEELLLFDLRIVQ